MPQIISDNHPRIDDPHFRAAVDALSVGDLPELQRLLKAHPYLAQARAEESGEYAGPYFCRPYLLEFVAENPIRTRKLPANICEIAQAIIDAGTPREALDKTIGLVASGCVPRECGVQDPLLELLVKNGANPAEGLDGAVAHGENQAAQTLLGMGAEQRLLAACGLGNIDRVNELLSRVTYSNRQKESALHAALRHNQQPTAQAVLASGLSINHELLGNGTPLHHAAWFGHISLCEWLVEQGADLSAKDTRWNGTPAGWAEHGGHAEVACWLRNYNNRPAAK